MKLLIPRRGTWFIVCLVFLFYGCQNQSESNQKDYPFYHSGFTEGTSFHIKVSQLPDTLEIDGLKKDIDKLLNRIDHQMSTYIDDSELSLINKNISSDWLPISQGLYEVIKEAQDISHLSNGAFDITVGPLVNLWGFGPAPDRATPPSDAEVQEQLKKIGFKHLSIKVEPTALQKSIPEIYIDLSAIAKGYAVDQVGYLLEQKGIDSYMVEIGGEIKLKGKNIDDKLWRIAIEKPAPEKRAVEKILQLTDIGMATSGDYRNFFEVNGVRFSHTIDPKSGRPITHKLASVSVISSTTMRADALATAINVLGPELGFDLAEKNDIAAFLIIKNAQGFEEKATTAFSRYTEK